MGDPYFGSVVLLLHFDGTNGATSFTDSSEQAWTVSGVGGAALTTTGPLFGTAALNTPSGTALIDCSSDGGVDFRFGTGDFTVEGQCNTTVTNKELLRFVPTSDDSWNWYVLISASGYLEWWRFPLSGSAVKIAGATTAPVNTGAWKSWAASRVSGVLKLFVDGVEVASASDTTNYAAVNNSVAIGPAVGKHEEVRITKGVGRYSATYTPQTAAFPDEALVPEAYVAAASMLGAAHVVGHLLNARVSDTSPLRSPSVVGISTYIVASAASPMSAESVLGWHDFTGQLDDTASMRYVMDLVTPGGTVRVPISSWQATLQTDVQSYVQCVVPAATDWVPDIEAATAFVISRIGTLLDGSTIEYQMAGAPAQTVSLDGGAYNYTATISGYTDALTANEDPPTTLDRALAGVRTVSRNSGNTRVRCSIDWMLRPGQRAYLDDEPIVVSYVNYYVPGFDQYMDIGDRAA